MNKANIFISYSSKEPDKSIATSFYHILKKAGHNPFLAEKSIKIGEKWSDRITEELHKCDYFVVFLSENSVVSDMVTEEVRKAKEISDNHKKNKPLLLPIRLDLPFNAKINYDLAGYINRIHHRNWKTSKDTYVIAKEILAVIGTGKNNETPTPESELPKKINEKYEFVPLPNAPLEVPGGTISLGSQFYIERANEKQFINKVLYDGSLLKIKGPRQFGKTSLLARVIEFARQNNHAVIPISFQQINAQNLQDLRKLLIQICAITALRLDIPANLKAYWDDTFIDIKTICTTYFEDYILKEAGKPVLLAIDEADRLFEYQKVSSEFFGLLRFWHEESKNNKNWRNVKLAISHSTEAYLAITDINQSPFNVGIDNVLREFTFEQVSELAVKHSLNLTAHQIAELMDMIGGHPFLVRKALYELARKNYTFDWFIDHAADEDGPYSDHLRRHLLNLSQCENFLDVMREILRKGTSDDVIICGKLRAAGIITGNVPNVKPSFKLYEKFFKTTILNQRLNIFKRKYTPSFLR